MTALRPTLELLVVALVCYGAYLRWQPDDGTTIALTPQVVDELAERQQALYGRPLSEAERDSLLASYLEQELLVREAFRRGLDRGDRLVRSMLVDHARRELLRAASFQPADPSEAELRAFFQAHKAQYRIPERLDLHQVFFPAGTEPADLDHVLARLRRGTSFTQIGAAGPAAQLKDVSRSQMARALGLELANEVFALTDGRWEGPFVSTMGTHFFRVHEREAGRARSFDDVREYVAQDWAQNAEDRALESELARIRRSYRVVVDDAE